MTRPAFVALALVLYAVCALLTTWPATPHAGDHYLGRPAPGAGEAAAGDHLQLGWALWLPGHQLEHGRAPWSDPYTFRPEATAPPNLQGWLLAPAFWPLDRLAGHVVAYNLAVWLSVVLAGALACWWLRALELGRAAALAGGTVYALAPYLAGQRTGHLLGLIAFLLPALLLALERRRLVVAALVLAAIPLSGQVHLALGAVPLAAAYAWARLERREWPRAAVAAGAGVAAAVVVQQAVIEGSIAGGGRSLAQVERYSAEWSDFVRRGVGAGVEELVFLGWLTPLLALAGLAVVARRGERGLAWLLGAAVVLPTLLALGTTLPLYERLWDVFPPLRYPRVPERLMPVAWLAVAALVAFALSRVRRAPLVALAVVAIAADLHVEVFGAVRPDRASAAYAAVDGPGRLLELPVFRPDLHYGSVFMAYARQSPRERPQGYSTTAPPEADRLARELRGLSCGRGELPGRLGVRFVAVHRGLYAQSGFFGPDCPEQAERWLRGHGWRLLARDGPISAWAAPR